MCTLCVWPQSGLQHENRVLRERLDVLERERGGYETVRMTREQARHGSLPFIFPCAELRP